MHPILTDRRRLFVYVLAWELLGVLLSALLVLSGILSWRPALALVIPLTAFYAFVCLGAFWVCRAAPLRLSGWLRVAGAQLAGASLSACLWLLTPRVWASGLEKLGLFPALIAGQRQAAPLLFGMGLLLFLLAAALNYLLLAF